jgi:hypothetical protein
MLRVERAARAGVGCPDWVGDQGVGCVTCVIIWRRVAGRCHSALSRLPRAARVLWQQASRTACDVKSPGASNELQQRPAPLWPTGQPGVSWTVVQPLLSTLLSVPSPMDLLRPGAHWERAAEAIARGGSAVWSAATTIARRAGASKSLRACVYPCQNRRRHGSIPAGPPGQLGRCCAAGLVFCCG